MTGVQTCALPISLLLSDAQFIEHLSSRVGTNEFDAIEKVRGINVAEVYRRDKYRDCKTKAK